MTRDREALTQSMNRSRSTQPASDMEMLITERDRIDNSHSIADSVLETAYATRNEFGRQRQTLTRINQRLMQSASTCFYGVCLQKVQFQVSIRSLVKSILGKSGTVSSLQD